MTDAVEARIEKLLRLADGVANEHESASALAMAQKLADAHNLDLGTIGKTGAREDKNVSKGLYPYQRTLYATMADLNHCKAWITKGTYRGSKYTTRLLGSKVNVALALRLCDYVEEVANRLVRENMAHVHYFSKEAHQYREGVIDRMVERIRERRRVEEREREAAKREQEARMAHPSAARENALVLISDVAREEEKANYDYLNGEGAWDAKEARAAAREAEYARIREEQRQYELDHPEEVAEKKAAEEARWKEVLEANRKRQERLDRAADRRRQERIDRFGYDPQDYKGYKPTKYDSAAYQKGARDGESVGIDDQIDHKKKEAIK